MRLQTDLDFKIKLNNSIKNLMLKCFIRNFVEGKLLLRNKNFKEFKKILLKSMRFEKMKIKKKKIIKPNKLIKNAAENMNKTVSTKYGLAPEKIEKRSLNPKDGKNFQEIYDFLRFRKIQNNQMRNDKYNQKLDRRKNTLRSPLNLTEKALVLAERLRKKLCLIHFIKAQLKICLF